VRGQGKLFITHRPNTITITYKSFIVVLIFVVRASMFSHFTPSFIPQSFAWFMINSISFSHRCACSFWFQGSMMSFSRSRDIDPEWISPLFERRSGKFLPRQHKRLNEQRPNFLPFLSFFRHQPDRIIRLPWNLATNSKLDILKRCRRRPLKWLPKVRNSSRKWAGRDCSPHARLKSHPFIGNLITKVFRSSQILRDRNDGIPNHRRSAESLGFECQTTQRSVSTESFLSPCEKCWW
jgi:hypothetical protein